MFDISYMQMHLYLEHLIGSKIAIRLVRTLIENPNKIYTVRKLADDSQVSISEAASIVRRLEDYGVLRIQPVGRAYLLTINKESYVLKAVLKPIIEAERATYDILNVILESSFDEDKIQSATLFGSVAARTEQKDSDIDLLVVSDDFDAATTFVAKAQEKLSQILSGKISPLIMNRKELIKKKNDALVQSILRNYITIAGKDLTELVSSND